MHYCLYSHREYTSDSLPALLRGDFGAKPGLQAEYLARYTFGVDNMMGISVVVLLLLFALTFVPSESLSSKLSNSFLLAGGTGKIGTAVANHLLHRQPEARITLSGRSVDRGKAAVRELQQANPGAQVRFRYGNFKQDGIQSVDQSDASSSSSTDWSDLLEGIDCIIHTAGPYAECRPVLLQAAIAARVPVYVDVADPLPYLEMGVLMTEQAAESGTTAILAAGAFPGMSNVLGLETAASVMKASGRQRVKDIRFNYFTAGLGGSGTVNLFITNVGFGDPMGVFDQGQLRFFTALSGLLLGTVDFFLPPSSEAGFGNEAAKERIGTKQVFAWPFPEAATVAAHLKVRGSSSAAMGTAPDIWNSMLGLLVAVVPRSWWRSHRFSQFMADFSEPLVWATDKWLRRTDTAGIGETHAMRIDVRSIDGTKTMSTVQAHDSFRQCVGQSCAEFALDCLEFPDPGVYLPEHRYQDKGARTRIIGKLTSTPGTFCYTGPIETNNNAPQPTCLKGAIRKAEAADE